MPASFSLHAAGSNARGQLATGNRNDALRFTPTIFFGCQPGALPPDVAAIDHIACGANHTLALLRMRDGTTHIWAAGDGSRGQLGPSYLADIEHAGEDASAVFRPLRLDLRASGVLDDPALDQCTVRFVAAGWETSYVVFSRPARDDVLLAMGADDFGNLATGGSRGAKQPLHIVRLRDAIPHQHTDRLLSILALTAGPHHTLVHVRLGLQDGPHSTHILGWGTARHGQLGPIPGRPPTFVSSRASSPPIPTTSPKSPSGTNTRSSSTPPGPSSRSAQTARPS
ncbi:hypothetical protein BN946_scf184753.g14 [Trametes cinnabarina]|uniref:Regulator of chromosome condensation 1/beta-lactamase-inhibitor protein II n=1 Tax=Pycnoporus cinnabarinus TaxID=5643 RepID=A0A060SYE7_PYCCI|nr:hypothetical protein BN946_scf184753.g14 [Trametes cinnabarina]